MRNKLIMLWILLLFGIFLMRGGITGFSVAENCESGSCDASGLEMPAYLSPEDSMALSGIGILLVTISSAMAFAHLKYKPSQEENK
jgi:hypothetical protein